MSRLSVDSRALIDAARDGDEPTAADRARVRSGLARKLALGAAAGAVTLVAVTKAATGSWVPFIPLAPAAGLVLGVGALVAGAVMIPFYAMSRREPALAEHPGALLDRRRGTGAVAG